MTASHDGFTAEVTQLEGAAKNFAASADTAWEAIRSFTEAGDAFRRASSGMDDLLNPAHEKWSGVEAEVSNVQLRMHEVIDKTAVALTEIARRYREQG